MSVRLAVLSGMWVAFFAAAGACSSSTSVSSPDDVPRGGDAEGRGEQDRVIIGGEDNGSPDNVVIGHDKFGDDDRADDDRWALDLPDVHPDADTPEPADAYELDLAVDDEATWPDGPCTPDCSKQECGSDGCEGVCGYCAYGYVCSAQGACVASICPKQCTTEKGADTVYKDCGPDGCNGYCGFCMEAGSECGPDGFCHAGDCKGACKTKVCGDDGCGHSCGNCQLGEMCSDKGQCAPHPCGTITYKGMCEDKYNLVVCADLALVKTNCKTKPDSMCGWDQYQGKYDCIKETTCEPKCKFDDGSAKECGPDGCWGSCGMCPTGWGCAGSLCKPAPGGECAWVDGIVGACVNNVKWFCSAGILYDYDCKAKENKKCAWDFTANFGAGGYDCI